MKSALTLLTALLLAASAVASDWPQFMRDAAHTGDAADEALALPLGLVAQVKLDDAVMTSPAVVGGLVYVVDQMGTAYCIDPRAGRIVWKASPDGERAMGSNTSSPCVAKGRMYYGTTAGTFHILDCKDGKVVKTVAVGMPIISSPTFANDSVYFQGLDAVVRCLDLDGNEKWTWDHYKRYVLSPEDVERLKKPTGSVTKFDRPQYGGTEVAVAGKKVVTGIGWDLLCIEDQGASADFAWCRRVLATANGGVPACFSISGDTIHVTGLGPDGHCMRVRASLKDGTINNDYFTLSPSFPWVTFPVRGDVSLCRSCGYMRDEIQVWTPGKSRTTVWQDPKSATPLIASPVLAGGHIVAGTLNGELLVLALAPTSKAQPFVFKTPHGKGIGSTPAVSGGSVFFGCDDGYLYVLGPGGSLLPAKDEKLSVHQPRSKLVSATGKAYGSAFAAGFADDPGLKPPLRLRWATRGFGHFKTPCTATEEGDLISISLQRTVTCQEQATGRMRWRMRLLPGREEFASSAAILVAGGRAYVPCPSPRLAGELLCLDLRDGRRLWSAPIGAKHIWLRDRPLAAGGKIIFSHLRKGTPLGAVIQAWDAETGNPAWEIALDVPAGQDPLTGPAASTSGCAAGDVLYFGAGTDTLSIDAKSGKVLWRRDSGGGYPVIAGDQLLVLSYERGMRCLSPADGSLLWQVNTGNLYMCSLGPDFVALRGYGGHGAKLRLADGKEYPGLKKGGQLGGAGHACSPVALTRNCSFAITVDGLNVRDTATGELLWQSPGFAPRGCVNPSLANGRVFWPSAASGMIFCWEPEK